MRPKDTTRHTKRRQFDEDPHPLVPRLSDSRPSKPPAKALHGRRSAALMSGGDHLPPALRSHLDREAAPRRKRTTPMARPGTPAAGGLRAGKRTPRQPKKRRS